MEKIQDSSLCFNRFNPSIQFTVEVVFDNAAPFLDRVTRNSNQSITLDWHTEPTLSGRYINYSANHLLSLKVN